MKIIVQAGGLGTRMKTLSRSKPKSLITAKYMPILFHIFEKYPNDEFIIIGDYKFATLDSYLSAFAKQYNFILLKVEGKGNATGIKDAVELIPNHEPFMIIWSDIILSAQFNVREIRNGCQVGIADFPCSWSLIDGKLVNEKRDDRGVAGLFVFDSKKWFDDFPAEGSFTTWLAQRGMPLNPISLRGSVDVGTLEAHIQLSSGEARCRPYNKIEFLDGRVVKTGLTAEANALLEREILWYQAMKHYGFKEVPIIFATDPLTMELIDGTNVYRAQLDDAGKRRTLEKLIRALRVMHAYTSADAVPWDLYQEYFAKTIHRLQPVISAIPYGSDRIIRINGRACINVFRETHVLRQAVLGHLMRTRYCPIHGDCQLTNTMISSAGEIYFIDARGYFGKSKVLGDVRYDWAKLYYAVCGNWDQYNVKNFDLEISDSEVTFSIGSGGWEHLTPYMMSHLPESEARLDEIKLIHSIIWLSMASHAWEDYDSMCVAFYNGTLLFNEWLAEFGQ